MRMSYNYRRLRFVGFTFGHKEEFDVVPVLFLAAELEALGRRRCRLLRSISYVTCVLGYAKVGSIGDGAMVSVGSWISDLRLYKCVARNAEVLCVLIDLFFDGAG